MLSSLADLYAFFFSRKYFYKFNRILYILSLRGMGVLNYKSSKQSGEYHFLVNYLAQNKEGIVMDVGANVGNYAKLLNSVNSKIEVYCFEPHPATYKTLIENIVNLNIQSFNVGVGGQNGTLTLYDYEDRQGSEHASLYKEVIENIHGGKSTEHNVEMISLDSFAKEKKISSVLLLKIDTEGHELAVLKGFKSYIKEHRIAAIHFEFNGMNVISRTFFRDFWELLSDYDFYRMTRDGLILIEIYNPVYCEIFAYQNIVAKLKDRFR